MKKSYYSPKLYLFLGLMMLIVFFAVQFNARAQTGAATTDISNTSLCYDSDGGYNLYEKGTLKTSFGKILTDTCTDETGLGVPSGYYINEFVCSADNLQTPYKHTIEKCPNGCKDGTCLPETIPPQQTATTPTSTCSENCKCDAYGKVIECIQPTVQCPSNCKCDNYGKIIECAENTTTVPTSFECPNNCKCDVNGKILSCVTENQGQAICTDTDNGENIYEAGKAYMATATSASGLILYDKCSSNSELAEAICTSEGPKYVFDKCEFGCENNACVKKGLTCKDSDGGANYFVKGYVEFPNDPTFGNKGRKDDMCQDDKHLSEYVCENGVYSGDRFVFCPDGCKDGACVGQATGVVAPQSTTSGGTSETTNGVKKPLPPAGYEDTVLTNPTGFDNPFPDTNINTLQGQSAAELYRRGVIGGFPDGEFKSDRLVNRAETAKFLLLARFGTVEDTPNNGMFPDVMDGQWYTKYVVTAANLGIIKGYPDGTFKPANNVNTAEFLKMLTLAFNLDLNLPYTYSDVSATDWFAQYAGVAQKYNLFPDRTEKLDPGSNLTRSAEAVAIYSYLKNK